jgi:hypothetical protein
MIQIEVPQLATLTLDVARVAGMSVANQSAATIGITTTRNASLDASVSSPASLQALTPRVAQLDLAVRGFVPGDAPEGLVALAGETLSGHRAVILSATGAAYYADKNTLSHIGRVYGITVNAALVGGQVQLVRVGNVTESGWNWTPDVPVYLGANGVLTQVEPTIGFLQAIGIAVAPTTLFVSLHEPFLL